MSEKNKIKSSIKYPTSIIIRGDGFLGVEIAKSLIEQGGYVVVIDHDIESMMEKYKEIDNQKLLTLLDFSSIEYLEEDLRRLDYVFYLGHEYLNLSNEISSQEFLQSSNYLDLVINLTNKFEAKLLLSGSIKAHQIIINTPDIAINLEGDARKKHAIYTQLEIQRYSEALLMESIDKLGLDARVVRLGRVIGRGMNFDLSNSFDKLIFQAVRKDDFEVEADGLETNFYIHVLDGAYGLIKAMFTQGTKKKIFSLSNEEEITDLSLAYKLQELTGLNREIKFKDSNDLLPPIRFYKPGISLSTLGWAARIPFTRAINQVIDYASEILAQKSSKKSESQEEGLVQEAAGEIDEPKGALARLIAERKIQDKARRGSILMASEQSRTKAKAKRNLTRGERFQRKTQIIYDSIASRLTFLKKITVVEAFFYLILLTFFLIIYVGIVSPVFVIAKNILQIEYYRASLIDNLEEENYAHASGDLGHISSSIDEMQQNVKDLEIVYKIAGKQDEFDTTYSYVRQLSLYTNELDGALSIVADFDEYWRTSELGVAYLPNSQSLFKQTGKSGSSESEELIKSYESQIDNSIDSLDTTSALLFNRPAITLIGYDTEGVLQDLKDNQSKLIEALNLAKNYSRLLLSDDLQTIAIVVQDNSRYTPAGGYPASIGFVQVKDSQIIDVHLSEVNSENDKIIPGLTDSEIGEIQTASSSIIDPNTLKLSDLFLMRDRERFSDDIAGYYSDHFGVNPDLIVYIDLETIANSLEAVGAIELNKVKIERDTLLNSINLLQATDKTREKRNQIITNIFAAQINSILTQKDSLYAILPEIYDASLSKSIGIEGRDIDLAQELIQDIDSQSDDWLQIGILSDPEAMEVLSFPSIDIKIEDSLDEELATIRKVTLGRGNTKDLERFVICLPTTAKDFGFEEGQVSIGQTFSQEEVCLAGDFDLEKEVQFSYTIDNGIENLSDGRYNKTLELISSAGVDIVYDYEASISSRFSIVEEQDVIISNQQVISAGTLDENKLIVFKIAK